MFNVHQLKKITNLFLYKKELWNFFPFLFNDSKLTKRYITIECRIEREGGEGRSLIVIATK